MATIMVAQIGGVVAGQRFQTTLTYHVASPPAVLNLSTALARGLGLFDSNTSTPGLQIDPDKVIGRMLACMAQDTGIDLVRIFDQYSDTDFYATPISPILVGGIGDSSVSPAVTYKLTSSVVRRDIRPGQKAIPGVPKTGVSGGGGMIPSIIAALDNLAAAMSAPIEDTQGANTVTFTPCVVSKERYSVPGSGTPPRFAYRFYADKAVQLDNTAIGVTWSPKNTVRTQTSRQIGRGI